MKLGTSGVMDAQLADVLDSAWQLLRRGAADRRSPLHVPVVAGGGGARTMVMRAAVRADGVLRFHTDARSPKCAALADRRVEVLGYHPAAAVQLRIAGTARVMTQSDAVDAIWAGSTPFARRCYLTQAAPGTRIDTPASGLPEWVEGRAPSEAELVPARANFAVLVVEVDAIDWLHLAQTGHRRARFDVDDGWRGAWLVP